jgi:rhamnulokinase
MSRSYVAVDLGASSGRVMTGRWDGHRVELVETHRFATPVVRRPSGLHWDLPALQRAVETGVRRALDRAAGTAAGVGVDGWGVDYGLLDGAGELLGLPYHYRDARTDGRVDAVRAVLPDELLYAVTGIQLMQINTVYQLVAARDAGELAAAATLLLLPDLVTHRLGGPIAAELTNASTTALLDARHGTWSAELLGRLELPTRLFPPLQEPATAAGELRGDLAGATAAVPLTRVASHDTASAVVAVPATGDRFAYISCGTWSLVGMELPGPLLTDDSRRANVTNERGLDGTSRYLKNVMGLWLLQQCQRTWARDPVPPALDDLLGAAAREPALAAVVDPDDPVFLPPGDMPARIAAYCAGTGQPVPAHPAAFVRCILDSLALAHRRVLTRIERLTGRTAEMIHLVGGGSANRLLCQLTADACGRPVLAGPVEATALGNVLVQLRRDGQVHDRSELRAVAARSAAPDRYTPRGGERAWAAAADRLFPALTGSPP